MNGINAAFGFEPIRKLGGGMWTYSTNRYAITSGYATSIFTGDPVVTLADGSIGIGVAGSACCGIFMGCKYQLATADSAGNSFRHSPYWPASTTVKTGTVVDALILDDPDVVFRVQESDNSGTAGTPLALADRNLNVNFRVGTGNTATGLSAATIDNSTEATTATLNMKILDLAPFPSNENPVGNFAVWLVTWNNHQFKGGTGTAGT